MKSLQPIILLFFIVVLATSCEKFEIDNSDKAYPIELTITQNKRDISLNWTKVNVSSFKEYIVVRSAEPIEDDIDLNSFNVSIAARIDDFEENTFVDREPVLSDASYYKIFVDIGDRFLKTPSKKIELKIKTLPFFFNRAAHSKINNKLYFHDSGNNVIWLYDYVRDSVMTTTPMNTWNVILNTGNSGHGEELYAINNTLNDINFYGGNTLNDHGLIDLNNDAYAIAAGNGILVVAENYFNHSIGVYKRTTKALVSEQNFTSYFDTRRLGTLSRENNEFIEVSSSRIDYYDYDIDGNLESHTTQSINFKDMAEDVAVSPDGQYFIGHLDGTVYDKSLNEVDQIISSTSFSNFRSFAFSTDGTKVYAVNSNQAVEVFSFPALELQDEYNFSFNPTSIFVGDNHLITVGLGFVSPVGTRTIIDIIDL